MQKKRNFVIIFFMKHKYVLFDLDNTLMDFNHAEKNAFYLTVTELGVPFSEELYKKYHLINDGWWKKYEKGLCTRPEVAINRFKDLVEYLNIDIDPEKFNSRYVNNLQKGDKEIDGATKTVKAIYDMGATIYIATNGILKVQRERLKNKEFMKYVKDVFVSEDLGAPKPSLEFFKRASLRNYFPLDSQTVIVGDSLTSDIKGGINAGIATCFVNSNGTLNAENLPITYTVKNITDVIDVLK